MSLLVSIDPGLRQLGMAVFRRGRLEWAGLVRNPEKKARGPKAWLAMAAAARAQDPIPAIDYLTGERPDVFVTELMQVDGRRGRVSDLFELYGVAMWVGHALRPAEVHGYYPRQWKGSVPKEVMTGRIQARLTEEERRVVQLCKAKSLNHNIWDSIGVGLHHLGRLSQSLKTPTKS